MGIFSGPGVGKSTLMSMIAKTPAPTSPSSP
jgi:flagellar biosynthesis/type III secretory pathway ATPase